MEKVSIETILCLPHNQFRFKYKINDGSFHFIDKWKTFDFMSQYIKSESSQVKTLKELILSFLPFIIIPRLGEVFELSKLQVDDKTVKRVLDNISEKDLVLIKAASEKADNQEKYPNDHKLNSIQKSLLK